jgi:UDP-N-acetylmuramyl pentapeptide phosphotransferase/UDP-N-acetylglucosamine-1-phosphate transferase
MLQSKEMVREKRNKLTPKKTPSEALRIQLLLVASLIFSIVILVILPSHFSVVSVILLLTSFFALLRMNDLKKQVQAYRGAIFCFAFSLAYLLLILYWTNAGATACSEFFGSYRSCLGSAQQVFIEIFATPVILLTATQPIFGKRIK